MAWVVFELLHEAEPGAGATRVVVKRMVLVLQNEIASYELTSAGLREVGRIVLAG